MNTPTEEIYASTISGLSKERTRLTDEITNLKSVQLLLVDAANKLDNEVEVRRKELDRVKFLASLQRARATAEINDLTEANERMRKELTKFMHNEELLLNTMCILHRELWAVEGAELQWKLTSDTLKKFNKLDKG